MGIYSSVKNKVYKVVFRKLLVNLADTSNENIYRKTAVLENLTKDPVYLRVIRGFRNLVKNDHPSINLVKRLLKESDTNCRNKIIENLIISGLLIKNNVRKKIEKKGKYNIPVSVLISPTMRCNLKCIGCYAANYDKKDDLGFDNFDRIVSEAEKLGVAVFTILGGEPLIVKNQLFEIFRRHSNSYFQFFTNATLIDDNVAEELRKLGNAMPIISIEGYEKETDTRRGKGIYRQVMKAMDVLKAHRIPFGFSATVTSKNAKLVSSEEFLDFMIKKGAYIGWYFLYMPLCKNPDLKLMPTPKQRKHLLDRWIKVRDTKPIFVVDFWNDAPYVGGCIAGRHYVHVNSHGDVEPCIFTHFAVDNIKKKPLNEIMQSEFFREIRKKQPFNENLFMPCMWIDNPEVGKEMCEKFGCYPTHPDADIILKDKKIRKGLEKYSKEIKKIYDPVWVEHKKRFPTPEETKKNLEK